MNYLFLDIDGVLNSVSWFERRSEMPEWHEARKSINQGYRDWVDRAVLDHKYWQLDPDACKVLEGLVEEHCLRIVVSSTWRFSRRDEVEKPLQWRGIRSSWLWGRTEHSGDLVDQGHPDYYRPKMGRGIEIEHWLLTHVPHDEWDDLRIVVLDDDSDTGRLAPWHVHTDNATGLLPSHAPLVAEALTKPLNVLLDEPLPLWTEAVRKECYG